MARVTAVRTRGKVTAYQAAKSGSREALTLAVAGVWSCTSVSCPDRRAAAAAALPGAALARLERLHGAREVRQRRGRVLLAVRARHRDLHGGVASVADEAGVPVVVAVEPVD